MLLHKTGVHGARATERMILMVTAMSSLGGWLYRLALPLDVLRVTHSAEGTALMYTLEFVPYMVLGPLAGKVADRVNRRHIIIGVQVAAALWAGAFGLLRSDPGGIIDLFVFGGILSSSQVFIQPAFSGLIPTLVSRDRIGTINARIQSIQSVLMAVGPAFGALVAVGLGVQNAVLLDGLSFGLAAGLLALIRKSSAPPSNAQFSEATPSGSLWQYLKGRPDLLYGIFLFAGTNFGLMAIEGNILFIVSQSLSLPRALAGTVLGTGGLGALLGSLVSARVRSRGTVGRIVVLSMALAGLLTIAVAMTNWILLSIAWALVNCLVSIIVVTWLTFQQETVPKGILGRLTAAGAMISFAAIPAGAIVGAYLVGRDGGLLLLVLVAGGVQIVAAGIGYRSKLWNADTIATPTPEGVRSPSS